MHTNPEVLALLALGEHVADPADRQHLESCAQCREELESLTRLITQGRSAPDSETLDAPSEAVWAAIQAELGFIPVTRSWPTGVVPADPEQAEPAASALPAASTAAATAPAVVPPAPVPPAPVSTAGAPGSNGATVVTETSVTKSSARAGSPSSAGAPPPPRTGRRVLSLVLAAVVALVAGIGIGLAVGRLGGQSETVIANATLAALPAWPGASGTAKVEVDAAGNRTLFVDLHTTSPVVGDQQVWLADATVTGMRAMGFLDAEGQGSWPIPPGLDLSTFPVVDVSDEPATDANPAHSGNSIVRGELQQ